MLKLYYLPGACSLVPHVALEWAKAEYEAQEATRELIKSPEYLALNPQGAVPLLQEGDWVLSQNVAILDYLNQLYPQAALFGRGDAKHLAKSRQWLAFVNADIHPNFSMLFGTARYLDDEAGQAQLRQKVAGILLRRLAQPNAVLAEQDYLNGEITIADVYLYVTLRWAKALSIDLSSLPALEGFCQRVESNAGVQSALKQQGLL